MKKSKIIFKIIILIYVLIGNIITINNIIPDDAIRIRVIANSNSEYDQKIKEKVKVTIESDMYKLLNNTMDLDDARNIINNNLIKVEKNIYNTLRKENYQMPFTIKYGLNYFPEKEFKGIKYKEGYYESVVVTLGEGLGDNWWCVLFPPLCMLEAEESTNVEYTTIVKTLIDKYF